YYARRGGIPSYWPAVVTFRKLQREVVSGVGAVLANSQAELDIMNDELGVTPRQAFVVPPPFDPIPAKSSNEAARRDILCVGRIEPRKNQISIIRAFKMLPRSEHRLIFFGSCNSSHKSYVAEFQKELVEGWVEYR